MAVFLGRLLLKMAVFLKMSLIFLWFFMNSYLFFIFFFTSGLEAFVEGDIFLQKWLEYSIMRVLEMNTMQSARLPKA